MTDILTRLCLVGAAASFSAWLVLANRRRIARAADALAKMSRPRIAAFLAFAAIATVCAQKSGTNDPPQGAGAPLHFLHFYTANPPAQLFRLESESTNETYSYAMPTNGARYGNWWLRGAYEDVFRLDLDGLLYPLGTNLCDSLWVYTWGMVGARLGDVSNRLVAAGVPMSAVPRLSQFWSAETDGGGRLLTWQDFALNRDTNTPVSAQLELMPSGDYIVRSNEVERVYRRVNPDDWDDDGIPNDYDIQPLVYDGDNFGPHQELPEGANTNHYYWIDVVVSQANARVTFAGDGYSHLPDPVFIARAGETNRVMLLLGKPYDIHCNMPIQVVGKEDDEVEVSEIGGSVSVAWPVQLIFGPLTRSSNGVGVTILPQRANGGGFGWARNFCCYHFAANGTPVFDCEGNCGCGGCSTGDITYGIGGHGLSFDGIYCVCHHDGDPSSGGGDDVDPPVPVGASVLFSKDAVLFESSYTNSYGQHVNGQSTTVMLTCVVRGGEYGGQFSFSLSGGERLSRISGDLLPVEGMYIPPGDMRVFSSEYQGRTPSAEVGDIVAHVTFTEDGTGASMTISRH